MRLGRCQEKLSRDIRDTSVFLAPGGRVALADFCLDSRLRDLTQEVSSDSTVTARN